VRVYLGSDHAGFELKRHIAGWLARAGHEPVDCGPVALDQADDYPPYVMHAANAAVGDPGSLAIVIGGSGNGEQIAANKIPGVRAALAWTEETARLARQHNNANVLSLGARMYSADEALSFARVFVQTPFSGEQRHIRRLEMIAEYEKTGELPAMPARGSHSAAGTRDPAPRPGSPGPAPGPRTRDPAPGPGSPGPAPGRLLASTADE
jgi:ribose 5-phosphate isomerase B